MHNYQGLNCINSPLYRIITPIKNAYVYQIQTINQMASGFFIKLIKGDQDFYCLMTNEHVVNKKMIEKREIIKVYNKNKKNYSKNYLEIKLNPKERLIKDFRDIKVDATVIEILLSDNIPQDYFLLPNIDYMNKSDELIGKDITIYQYPRGILTYSHGEIKGMTEVFKYEFAHTASTDKGSSGSPIFLKGTEKVIGIHKGGVEIMKENLGDFIWPIYDYFKNNFKNDSFRLYRSLDIKNENKEEIIMKNSDFKKNNKLNQMNIQYEIPQNEDSVELFGKKFVENNKENCYLLIDDPRKKTELCRQLILNKNQKCNKIIEIKLIEVKKISDMSYMFYGCSSLINLSDISEWDTKNVTNLSYMFSWCKSLNNIADISNWDTSKVTNMSYMFSGCKSLQKLPDISNWNTSNVTNMSYMFSGCISLQKLPDISNWDTKNVNNISDIFSLCNSLKYLPDISKWDTKSMKNMSYMFNGCKSLKSLPDISKWDTKNLKDISYMFTLCNSLKNIPDISKWDTKNVINMNYIFYECRALKSLPDLSNWKLNKKLKKEAMFKYCDQKIVPENFKY